MIELVELFIILPLKIFISCLFIIQNICIEIIQLMTFIHIQISKNNEGE